VVSDYRKASVTEAERALLDFAVKLTREPAARTKLDVELLQKAGWSDRAILDLTLVISYFAFVNRIAEGLGVEFESSLIAQT
jgi:uncharacterized peroxidase-related enzyme